MQQLQALALSIVFFILFFASVPGNADADITAPGHTISIRFPAFSLTPGQKISGFKLKSSRGRLQSSCLPSRWTCENQGKTLHCFTIHPSYATAMTGRLPEIFVRDLPASGSQLTIEASIEYLEGDGSERSGEFKESDLIIK